MSKPSLFWQALEIVPVGGKREAIWREAFGAEYALLAPYLEPNGQMASHLSCPRTRAGHNCHYRIVEHPGGVYAAVCAEDRCPRLELRREDLVLLHLSPARLHEHLCRALGLLPEEAPPDPYARMRRIGRARLRGGHAVPVHLLRESGPQESYAQVVGLLGTSTGPLLLLTPTGNHLPPPALDLLERRGGRHLALGDLLVIEAGGGFSLTEEGGLALRETLLRLVPPPLPAAPAEEEETEDPTHLFRRQGEGWLVAFEGEQALLFHNDGLAYIRFLIEHPEEEFQATKLRACVKSDPEVLPGVRSSQVPGSDAGPRVDVRALQAYRARLSEIDADLEEALEDHDFHRQENLQEERAALLQEISTSTGLGGRLRVAAGSVERARKQISNAINRSLTIIEEEFPRFGQHLRVSLRKGATFSYAPAGKCPWVF